MFGMDQVLKVFSSLIIRPLNCIVEDWTWFVFLNYYFTVKFFNLLFVIISKKFGKVIIKFNKFFIYQS